MFSIFFIGHLKQNYSTAELCLEELSGLMVWIPGYSSHARFNLEVDFSLLREIDGLAWWTLQLMLITGMKWAAPLLYLLEKSPKLAQKWGWKLSLRWGLSKSVYGILWGIVSVRAASWDPGKSIPSPWVFLIWEQPGWQHKVKFFPSFWVSQGGESRERRDPQ